MTAEEAIAMHHRMNRDDPFSWGWRHGFQSKTVCRRLDAENYFGTNRVLPLGAQYTAEQIDLYMAGREKGVAGDVAALLREP